MQELPSYFCASLCQVLEATAIQHLQAFPFNLHASLCQRLEATCTPHLQAPSSNLCASLCQRLEATGSTGTKHLQAVDTNISACLRHRLEATCKKTVHELIYSLACSNVVVGQAARRTFAGASFQTKLRLTFILNSRCCRHCSPYSPKSIAGEFGIANWSGPNTPTAVGKICAKRVCMGCEPNNFTSTLGLMRYVSMSMQFDP